MNERNEIDWFGLIPTFSIVAILYLSATLSMLLIPVFKSMNRPSVQHFSMHHSLVARGKGTPS